MQQLTGCFKTLGAVVGIALGDGVGRREGSWVGEGDGRRVGFRVGSKEGLFCSIGVRR